MVDEAMNAMNTGNADRRDKFTPGPWDVEKDQLGMIVPSRDLCCRIPEGCFVSSVFVYPIGYYRLPKVWRRVSMFAQEWKKGFIPAPTFQEVIEELKGFSRTFSISWGEGDFLLMSAGNVVMSGEGCYASIALSMWLTFKGVRA